jgi:stage III sporulation protein AC
LSGKGAGDMDVDLIFKIAGLGILISIFNIVLEQANKEEQAEMLTLVGVIIVLMVVIRLINDLFANVRQIFGF